MRRSFTTCARSLSHDNPLGLPQSKLQSRIQSRGPPPPTRPNTLPSKRRIPNIKKVIAISSAKGGVGKSTLAVNLALSFSRHKLRTGILDADIFGPSIPTLLGLDGVGKPEVSEKGRLRAMRSWGVGSMSMGYLLGNDGKGEGPVAWRGLMVTKAMQQLLFEVEWTNEGEELDVLVLDMPPGTGDVQLTVGQQVELDGAVVVSTPQDVALKDAVRGVLMFEKMAVRVLGMVRNMSVFVCPGCGAETRVFARGEGRGGLQGRMEEMGVKVLGDVPLDPQICYDADRGMPTIVAEEASGEKNNTRFYDAIAEKVAKDVGLPWG